MALFASMKGTVTYSSWIVLKSPMHGSVRIYQLAGVEELRKRGLTVDQCA